MYCYYFLYLCDIKLKHLLPKMKCIIKTINIKSVARKHNKMYRYLFKMYCTLYYYESFLKTVDIITFRNDCVYTVFAFNKR